MGKSKKRFTIPELLIALLAFVMLFGSVYRGAELIKESKSNRQIEDLVSIVEAVELYQNSIGRLPGDRDLDGRFDDDSNVWRDLESQELANGNLRSPYGGEYLFTHNWFASRSGNFILVTMPTEVAERIDCTIDDGDPWSGLLRCEEGYWGDRHVEVAHFLPATNEHMAKENPYGTP
jgi:hypothetical protein